MLKEAILRNVLVSRLKDSGEQIHYRVHIFFISTVRLVLFYSLRRVRESSIDNPWGWDRPESSVFPLDQLSLNPTSSSRSRNIPEYDVDAVLSAGELVIDEEELALSQNILLDTCNPLRKKKIVQKDTRKKSERKDERSSRSLSSNSKIY